MGKVKREEQGNKERRNGEGDKPYTYNRAGERSLKTVDFFRNFSISNEFPNLSKLRRATHIQN